jgi:2-polyprenyl-3-methyl-5-hydroxy-6-metoxy-1,4-benzoquinol methylase
LIKKKPKLSFDYSSIPLGYYDKIAVTKKGLRSFWHYHKFKRIIDSFEEQGGAILDIGCFAGTFLGMIPEYVFNKQVGIDILEEQVKYASQKYGKSYRNFYHYQVFNKAEFIANNTFDCITIIEVIEHLSTSEIEALLNFAHQKLKAGGKLILTTPNYTSAWPVIELMLNRFSDVKYEEQHITHFNYFNVLGKLDKIVSNFHKKFCLQNKTTTHMISPYIAMFSFKVAEKVASFVSPSKWKIPLGALLLISLKKI